MSNIKYKNYLEHEVKVKFNDGVLEQSQDWQWFIDYIEDNYDLSEIEDSSEFKNRSGSLIRVLSCFLQMLQVCDADYQFSSPLLSEIFCIARYYIGSIDKYKCREKMEMNFSKTLYLLIWLTKLQNADNDSAYLADFRIINQSNFHQAIRMDSLEYDKEKILAYLNDIDIVGFDQSKQNLRDNLNKVTYDVSENFFDKYRDNLLSSNCFNYQSLDREEQLTWQEHSLLDMLKISINDGQISPMFSGGTSPVPDYSTWKPDLLKRLKDFLIIILQIM